MSAEALTFLNSVFCTIVFSLVTADGWQQLFRADEKVSLPKIVFLGQFGP